MFCGFLNRATTGPTDSTHIRVDPKINSQDDLTNAIGGVGKKIQTCGTLTNAAIASADSDGKISLDSSDSDDNSYSDSNMSLY